MRLWKVTIGSQTVESTDFGTLGQSARPVKTANGLKVQVPKAIMPTKQLLLGQTQILILGIGHTQIEFCHKGRRARGQPGQAQRQVIGGLEGNTDSVVSGTNQRHTITINNKFARVTG
jgi:hypothetical protein